MKKFKFIIFILLIISFVIVLFYGIFGTSLSFLSSKEIKKDRKLKEDLINELKINNEDAIYDKNKNIYYYMVPSNYENNIYVLNLDLKDGFKYKIVGENLNIIKVDYSKQIKVIIYNDKYYYETKIQLTNLPLISITSESDITTNDTESIFTYINTNNIEKQFINNSKIHIRGASSKKFDKKSYKINMYNKSYKKEEEVNIENFYYGNSFILDAVYRDPSKLRNVLSTELWNDISNDFNNVDIYSEFVEVFINNEYKGIYVFTEPINRRRLNLNKSDSTDTSIIIKSVNWIMPQEIKKNYNIDIPIHLGYELKYPNDSEFYESSWDLILNKLSTYYTDMYSYEKIKNSFNLKNYIDIIIFNAFTNNSDNNLAKNNYFYAHSLNSKEIYIQPWDMEYSYGLTFASENKKFYEKNLNDYTEIYTLFYHEDCPEINKLLIDRYWELRKNILTKEYFDNVLDKYKNQLNKGAALRDSSIWYEYDIEEEIEEIRTWIYNRLDYFDSYIKDLENE
ncbi:MAG: hypothetical protein E7174_02860 [Firmicutes bacterium]|nr:hypothetical protein [Bacillota bacterium]